MLCGHCKFLGNIFVYFVEENYYSEYFRNVKFDKLQDMNFENFEKLISNAEYSNFSNNNNNNSNNSSKNNSGNNSL